MMVGPQHVDGDVGRVLFAVTLVPVVGDVAHDVGGFPVGFDDDPVLVIPILGGLEPGGPILPIDVPQILQTLEGRVHLPILVDGVLMEVDVEVDPEIGHGLLDLVEHHRHGPLAELFPLLAVAFAQGLTIRVLAAIHPGQGKHVNAFSLGLVNHLLGDFVNISALVTIGRSLLPVGGSNQGLGETVDLLAVVVEVILADHMGAVGLQDTGQGVADGRPPRSPDMDGAGGVGGDEFQVQGFACQVVIGSEGGLLIQNLIDDLRSRSGVQSDVDESGAGHFHGGDARVRLQGLSELLSQVPGGHAGLLTQLHGDIGRPVAMGPVFGAHNGDFVFSRNHLIGQLTGLSGGHQVVRGAGNKLCEYFRIHSC